MKTSNRAHTFVLVHGAGHGGWAWRRVSALLAERGHRVHAPSLTGLADRSHLMTGEITLDTHIKDIVNLFKWEEIENAVLVGHSYGGWVISGAVEHLEHQVSAMAYLDAFLPDDGQRGIDFVNDVQRASIQEALARGDVCRPGPTAAALKIQNPDDAAWVDARITPQPIGVSLQPIRLTGVRDRIPAKLYVRTPLFPSVPFDAALSRCQTDPGWRTAVMDDCGHDPMIDRPELVCELLEGLL